MRPTRDGPDRHDPFSGLGNPHLSQLEAALGPLRSGPAAPLPDADFLFLLFTNRCGSNFLAQALASTGCFNEAGEFFNADVIIAHARERRLRSIGEYLAVLAGMLGRNGRLAAKLAIENVEILVDAGIMEAILPRSRFILLERQDRLDQAISRVIAWQNQSWTTEHPKRIADAGLAYSRAWIDQEMEQIQTGTARLYAFLRSAGVSPIHFAYEHLVARPQEHLDIVADRLDLPALRFDPARVRIGRQAGETNTEWKARYLRGE